jgi:hypothetical protein
MLRYLATALCTLVLCINFANGQQLTRCQCSYKDGVGDCTAKVSKADRWITVTSNTAQCSRVDWYADGQPQVTVVTDGKETHEWLGQGQNPQLTLQSCKICKDAEGGSAGPGSATTTPEDRQETTPAASPFQGTWVGEDKNVYGYSNATRVQINVDGSTVTGTWSAGSEPTKPISGTIVGNKAKVKIHNGGTSLTLNLVDESTLKYKWMFSSAVLRKEH